MKKFTLPEGYKSNVINGHQFDENGELVVSNEDGAKLAPSLVRFYGCEIEDLAEEEVLTNENDDPSLSASNTKGDGSSDSESEEEED